MDGSDGVGALIRDAAGGNVVSFERLYDLTSGRVHSVVRNVVRDAARSDEVTQEVYVQIWLLADRCDTTRSPMGWIVSMAHRRAVDYVRSEERRRARERRFADRSPATPVDDPGDIVVSAASNEDLRAAIAALPVDERRLVRLAFFEGRTHTELAADSGLPLGTVKSKIRKSLRSLARALAIDAVPST